MPPQPLDEKTITLSLKVAIACLLFCIMTVAAGAAWAQNISLHLQNVDSTLMDMKDTLKAVQQLGVIQEQYRNLGDRVRTLEEYNRLERDRK